MSLLNKFKLETDTGGTQDEQNPTREQIIDPEELEGLLDKLDQVETLSHAIVF